MKNINLKIIDCTIRDGGHLNKWHFDPFCVKSSYYAALKSGTDYFEIGYRFPETMNDLGHFGYCNDDFLFSLIKSSEQCKLTVMIDAGKCTSSLFKDCRNDLTPVKAVRVATYPYELKKAIDLVEDIKNKGYEVFLNLMASSELTQNEYNTLKNWDEKKVLNSVCFADSFGSFIDRDVIYYFNKIKECGFENIGFHPHNNLQMAFSNTLKAIEIGAKYVDASIFGMGRGAGNLPIETLIGYFEKEGYEKYNTLPYLDMIERFYLELFQKYNWGYKIQSLLGGLKNVHPYYVDTLFKIKNYTIDEIWNALDIIKERCPISYSVDNLNKTLEGVFYKPLTNEKAQIICNELNEQFKIFPADDAVEKTEFKFSNIHKNKKFLIIVNGPSIKKQKSEIEKFITSENCITIGTNFLQNLYQPDYHVFVNKKRFLNYAQNVNKKSHLLIPSFFGSELVEQNYSGNFSFFNLETVEDSKENVIENSTQKCVNLNVAISSILIAYQMGASEIYVVGMDGYIDELNKKMVYFYNENNTIDDNEIATVRYEKLVKELERTNNFLQQQSVIFSIITPTTHKKYFKKIF